MTKKTPGGGNTQIVVKNQVILNLIQDLQRLLLSFVNGVRGRSRIKYGMTALFNNGGFTLIELLVVVLIIGILAAVALPQYQKAVEKSRAVQALTLLKTMYMAAEGFYMGNGVWPDNLDDLDLEIAWEGKTKWYSSATPEAISNQDWSLQLDKSPNYINEEVMVGRISGPYQGGGFVMFQKYYSDDMPLRTPVCAEIKGSRAQGKYCGPIFRGELFRETTGFLYYYLPQ